MCRLIGFVSPKPRTLLEVIGELQCSTFQHLSRLHSDGWGTMFLDEDNQISAIKVATNGRNDANLTAAMSSDRATGRVVHLRMATDGMAVRPENSHPFIADGIGLAHNGSIVPTDALRSTLSPEVLADTRGTTDSELYLAAIRQAVRLGKTLGEAVLDTASWLRSLYPNASLNALVMSADEFVAVHAAVRARTPLAEFAASGLGPDELPLDHVEEYYQMSFLRADDGTVTFASTGIGRSGWTALPTESVTVIDLHSFALTSHLLPTARE